MKKLTTYVHVFDEHGTPHTFGPDDDVPGWARKAITNPDVWASDRPQGQATPAADTTTASPTGDASAPAPAGDDAADEEVPTGKIDVVLGWVGDDPDRARRALDAERAQPNPRSSLVGKLEQIAEPPAEDGDDEQ